MQAKLKKLVLLFCFFLTVVTTQAGTVKGKVVDKSTNEPLIGATVELKSGEKKYYATVNLDGSYTFRNIPAGKYDLQVRLVGYNKSQEEKITINNESETIAKNFSLEVERVELKEVSVKSSNKRAETDEAARSLEKNSDYVKNILSQRSIEISPDVTIANSLQRMSGVTVQRSSAGEGRYAIIRGMDQRYNNTLVNGVKIPSPDNSQRYVPMDIFPSDMVERLEVNKALLPSMEGDAIGGSMNLVMKNAPNKRAITGFFALGANALFNDRPFQTFNQKAINKKDPSELNVPGYLASDADFPRSPLSYSKKVDPINLQAGFTYGDRFLNKRLGFIIGASFQNNYRGSDQIFVQQYAQPTYLPNAGGITGNLYNNYPLFSDIYDRKFSTQQRRLAFNNKWDYILNKNNKISLYNMYVRMDEMQARQMADSNINTNPNQLTISTRSRFQIQTIYNSTLQGEHTVSNTFRFNWSAVYSIAKQQTPDLSSYNVDYTVLNIGTSSQTVSPTGTLKGMNRLWTRNSDQDVAGYINGIWNKNILSKNVELSFGGLFRHKERDNYYHGYSLSPKSSPQVFTNIYDAKYAFSVTGDNGTGEFGTGRNYNIKEDVAAGYAQFKLNVNAKLQALGGVRVENTVQNYTTNLPLTSNGRYGKISYTDVLPSLHLKYSISAKQNLRASYFSSLIRPGYVDIVPYLIPANETDFFDQQGNPYLKHTTAENFDIRYELFPNGADQILIGGFFKNIHNPIEIGFTRGLQTGGGVSPGSQYITPLNFGDATNYGFELVATKYFGKFGINANYTYTNSNINTTKNYFYYDGTSGQSKVSVVDQSRPLQGQSKHIGNISFLYKDPKSGLDIQLAYVYTGEKLSIVSNYLDLDTWQAPYGQLDFSFEKKIVKNIAFYGKINNLTNSTTRFFLKQPFFSNTIYTSRIVGVQDDPANSIFVQRDTYGVSYLFGLRFKFKN
jgi:hypothetical protein